MTTPEISTSTLEILGWVVSLLFATFKTWEARNAKVARIADVVETGAKYAFAAAESIASVSNNPTLNKAVEAEKWFRKYMAGREVKVSQDMIEGALVIWESLHGEAKGQQKVAAASAAAAPVVNVTNAQVPAVAVVSIPEYPDVPTAVDKPLETEAADPLVQVDPQPSPALLALAAALETVLSAQSKKPKPAKV